jgi:c-di-GMP-binding flagellar brake protein YcgR
MTEFDSSLDRRRVVPRYDIHVPCRVRVRIRTRLLRRRTERDIYGHIIDVSVGGAAIDVSGPASQGGTRRGLAVTVLVDEAEIPAVIRHIDEAGELTRLGVEFIEPNGQFERRIFEVVERAQGADGVQRASWEGAS